MILCFSGTGNSRSVADLLQDILEDELVRLPPGLMRNPKSVKIEVHDERVIWVLPIHSWGMPWTCEKVLKQSVFYGRQPLTHYLVCTCGDDIGYADQQWRALVESRGWNAGSAFSVQMPNTYTFMKGFDVDPADVVAAKLEAMPQRVRDIAGHIIGGDLDTVDVARGSYPWIKTKVIHPWFNWWMTRTAPFHATDACVSCGKCVRNCPLGVISMDSERPKWNGAKHCTMCERCYHLCPTHAVAYGTATKGKGQYLCPGYKTAN